jgi:hypothetical protein
MTKITTVTAQELAREHLARPATSLPGARPRDGRLVGHQAAWDAVRELADHGTDSSDARYLLDVCDGLVLTWAGGQVVIDARGRLVERLP